MTLASKSNNKEIQGFKMHLFVQILVLEKWKEL